MAIENLLVYALIELPTLALSYVFRRAFSLAPQRAYTIANLVFFTLVIGACLIVWFFY